MAVQRYGTHAESSHSTVSCKPAARRARSRKCLLDPHRPHAPVEFVAEDAVPVAQQVPRNLVDRKMTLAGLDILLDRGMGRDTESAEIRRPSCASTENTYRT